MNIIEILDQQELYAAIIRLAINSANALVEHSDRMVDNQVDLDYLYKRVTLDTCSNEKIDHLRRFVSARENITNNTFNIVTRETTDERIARMSRALVLDAYDHLDAFKRQLPLRDFSTDQREEHDHLLGIKDRYIKVFKEKFSTHRTNLLNKTNFEKSLNDHPLRLSTLQSGTPLADDLKTASLRFFENAS